MSGRAFRHLLHSASATIWWAQASAQTRGALVLLTRRGSRRARIYSVVVSPAARGQGLGRRLVQRAEREARQLGYIGVSLEVRQDNQPARALYAALRYTVLARSEERRVGKAGVSRVRSRWAPAPYKKKA